MVEKPQQISVTIAAALLVLCAPLRTRGASATAESADRPEGTAIQSVKPLQAGLGDTVTITVADWPRGKLQTEKWVLYFDGVPLEGVYPLNPHPLIGKDNDAQLRFYLERNEKSKDAWSKLLRGPRFFREMSVGLGPEDGPEDSIGRFESGFKLVVIPKLRFVFGGVGVSAVILCLILLAAKSNMLRRPQNGPYSLGWTQMAWWFVVVLASYLYLGIVTWDFQSAMNASALVLLGISAGTAAGAALVDIGKQQRRERLAAKQGSLTQQTNALQRQLSAAANVSDTIVLSHELTNKTTELGEVAARLGQAATRMRRGFLYDLVCDADGVSLHRFQILVWTIVLGIVFLRSVVYDMAMPEFNATLLALMGISSGTYVGFKFPERS